jgi:hypothetical protein
MPNHVINRLDISIKDSTGTDEEQKKYLKEILDFIKSDKGEDDERAEFISFQKIDPMPDELKNTRSPNFKPERDHCDSDEEFDAKMKAYEKQRKLADKYGADNWYDWHVQNWGTKWDAYQSIDEGPTATGIGHLISFQTAWATPCHAIRKLSEKFPNAIFSVDYADEDIGSNCGSYECDSGELEDGDIPDNAVEYACMMWGYDYDEYCAEQDECAAEEDEAEGLLTCSKCGEDKNFTEFVDDTAKKPICLECENA